MNLNLPFSIASWGYMVKGKRLIPTYMTTKTVQADNELLELGAARQ